jgi:hypothetical protein
MVPEEVVELSVPITTGAANDPALFDSCAVNTLPALAGPSPV